MPRPYHSPSSIALAERCERAWYHAYVDGIRSPGSVATELGGAVHKVGEAYYRRLTGAQAPDWASRAGQIFTSALHLLPDPSKVVAYPEEALGGPWCGDDRVLLRPDGDVTTFGADGCRDDAKPGRAIVIDGCRYAGFRDLVVSGDDHDWREIGAEHALCNEFVLFDYKTSANPRRYGKTPAQLVEDFAANLYAIDVARQWDLDFVPCRWPYISTKGSQRMAIPVDFTVEVSRALDVVASRTPLVRRIDSFTRPEDAVCNTAACADYGGCPYHVSKGGPCKAQRKVSAFIMARSKGQITMALTPEQQARFDALKAKRKGAAAAPEATAPTEIPPPPAEEEDTQPDVGGPVEEETPVRATLPPTPIAPPRKAKAPAAPKATPAPAASGVVDPQVIATLAAAVAEAQAAVDEILSRASGLAEAEAHRDAAIANLRKALA